MVQKKVDLLKFNFKIIYLNSNFCKKTFIKIQNSFFLFKKIKFQNYKKWNFWLVNAIFDEILLVFEKKKENDFWNGYKEEKL